MAPTLTTRLGPGLSWAVVRRVVALGVAAVPLAAGYALGGLRGVWWGAGVVVLLALGVFLALPRAGHRAFARGKYAAARRRYRLVRGLALTRRRIAHALREPP